MKNNIKYNSKNSFKALISIIILSFSINFTSSNSLNDYLKEQLLENYKKAFILDTNNISEDTNKDISKNTNNKNKKIKKDEWYEEILLWEWKYRNEIEKKQKENYEQVKNALEQLDKKIIKETDVDNNIVEIYNIIKKKNEKGSKLVYLEFFWTTNFYFPEMWKTIVLIPFKIKKNWNEEKIFFLKEKIKQILDNSKKEEKEKFKEVKKILDKYNLKYIVIDDIIDNKVEKNFNLLIWEKLSFFEKPEIKLVSSNFYKNDRINTDNFYVWTYINNDDIDYLNKKIWKDEVNYNNYQYFIKLDYEWNPIYINLFWKNKDFITIQYSDKVVSNVIRTQYYYDLKKDNLYILYIFLSIWLWFLLAYLLFKAYYYKRFKFILTKMDDKI